MANSNVEQLPVFLQTYGNLVDHVTSQLEGLTSKDKGDSFADFVSKIIPLTDIGLQYQFDDVRRRKASYDEGVDLECYNPPETKLLEVQCKLRIKDVDEFDLIISKFQSFYKKYSGNVDSSPTLFEEYFETFTNSHPEIYFMVATLSNLERILPAYEKSNRASKHFYDFLKENGKFYRLDGPMILPIVQAAYRKLHVLPSNIELHLDLPLVRKGNVYIGIISALELRKCYDKFGDALFFENIRSFLGYSSGKKRLDSNREYVNEAILETAQLHPEKMLEKNNGITFRAKTVSLIEENTLRLDEGSIVNGCQTTMCLIRSPHPEAFVLVKIVETSNSWDVAKAANFQNRVEQVELELAQYIRPQLVKKFESDAEIHVVQSSGESIFDVFSSIYQDQVAYEEIYYLFIGLFSRKISNVISTNYTELDDDLLKALLSQEGLSTSTFATLFKLYKASQSAREAVERKYKSEEYKKILQRFWKDNKPNYRSMFTILATCGCIRTNIYTKQYSFNVILQKIMQVLENDKDKFVRYYHYAFEVIASHLLSSNRSEMEMLRHMYDDLRGANFENLYKNVLLIADGRENEQKA